MNPEALRLKLRERGFSPIPLNGKIPGFNRWQKQTDAPPQQIRVWTKQWPDKENTGVLTARTPTIDLDILDPAAAEAAEQLVREHFEEKGLILVRFGNRPKRAIPFRTDAPFDKIAVTFAAEPGAKNEKVEMLGDGQQFVVHGVHPDTGHPYEWFGGSLDETQRDELPYIHAEEAQQLVADVAKLLVEQFAYRLAEPKAKPRKNSADGDADASPADWSFTPGDLIDHDRLAALAFRFARSGMVAGALVNFLRAQVAALANIDEDRRKRRLAELPGMVDSALEKIEAETRPQSVGPPSTLKQTLDVFDKWLALKDHTPILATLGAVAANHLDGDPVWIGIVAPPSSAKTEIILSLSALPDVEPAATLTAAALLSGTPNKQRDKKAKGGLLRKIGDFGILALKDFGSILSMHPEAKAELLAALREIADGSWTRLLGTDGGKSLDWKGKLGLVFGVTPAIDAYHGVIGSLGDRWLLTRMAPVKGQFAKALEHRGAATKMMRAELAEAVARLFAGRRAEPRDISKAEIKRIEDAVALVVRLRGSVERDRRTRELDAVYGAEGEGRIGLSLERLLAGLDTLGVERGTALKVVESVALDSVPPQRRAAYEFLAAFEFETKRQDPLADPATTTQVAQALGLPTNTARRVLEDLAAYGLLVRTPGGKGKGKADKWAKAAWE